MNRTSQVFSHQRKIVEKLAHHFHHLDVVTAEPLQDQDLEGVRIFSTNWSQGRRILNIYRFYRISLPLLYKHRGGTVFSHMTDVQSSLIVLFCKLLRIRHVLWYAHKSPSFYLKFSYLFVDAVITSTVGSCPVSGRKVLPIGQSVDTEIANVITRPPTFPPKSWYHVGRIDPSKNIEMLIKELEPYHSINPEIELHFYGAPSSSKQSTFYKGLISKYAEPDYSAWVFFHGQVNREELITNSQKHDAFIHGFWGSLDKALIEATLLRRIVVSSNPEFLKEYYSISIGHNDISNSLREQLTQLYESVPQDIEKQIENNFTISSTKHGMDGWILRLVSILKANSS